MESDGITKGKKFERNFLPVDAKQTLLDLVDEVTCRLDELCELELEGELDECGEAEKAAYIIVLELIQHRWEESLENGLDYNIEVKYFFDIEH